MSRAMLVTVLYRMDGKRGCTGVHPFTDVAQNKYYSDAASWAYDQGIINGVTPDRFEPDSLLTREQIAAILYRYCEYARCDMTLSADLSVFADADEIHDYARTPIAWAVAVGLLNGTSPNTVSPRSNGTRAQAAALLLRLQPLLIE